MIRLVPMVNLPVLALMTLQLSFTRAVLQCRDAAGDPVDYWTGVKFPRPSGARYTYSDNTQEQSEWTIGDDLASTDPNPLSNTLGPLYNNGSVGLLLYNVSALSLLFRSGVIGMGPDGAFWLIHSLPKFPDRPAVSDYAGIPAGQQRNAQSFLCLSLTPSTLEKLAQQLAIEGLNIYSTVGDIPDDIAQQYPVTFGLISGNPSGAAKTSHTTFKTAGGESFVAFVTSSTDIRGGSKKQQFLYEDLVTDYFQSSVDVSTWPDEAGYEASFCPASGFITQNVEGVSVKEAGLGWKTTVDHSKWCVTARLVDADKSQVQVACVGDKNRADKQLVRGGGTVCFASNPNIWKLYTSLIDLVDSCNASAS